MASHTTITTKYFFSKCNYILEKNALLLMGDTNCRVHRLSAKGVREGNEQDELKSTKKMLPNK